MSTRQLRALRVNCRYQVQYLRHAHALNNAAVSADHAGAECAPHARGSSFIAAAAVGVRANAMRDVPALRRPSARRSAARRASTVRTKSRAERARRRCAVEGVGANWVGPMDAYLTWKTGLTGDTPLASCRVRSARARMHARMHAHPRTHAPTPTHAHACTHAHERTDTNSLCVRACESCACARQAQDGPRRFTRLSATRMYTVSFHAHTCARTAILAHGRLARHRPCAGARPHVHTDTRQA